MQNARMPTIYTEFLSTSNLTCN